VKGGSDDGVLLCALIYDDDDSDVTTETEALLRCLRNVDKDDDGGESRTDEGLLVVDINEDRHVLDAEADE
jgi:hypothetical protein